VSGTVGDAALGLRALTGDIAPLASADREFLVNRYRLPSPRIDLGVALRQRIHSALDVSDGVAQDLGHIAQRSGCGAEIKLGALPLSPAGRRALAILGGDAALALTGGDDYELLFTAAGSRRQEILDCAQDVGLTVTEIGRMVEGAGVRVLDDAGQPITLDRLGWRHR
jgi:thiamine-monophosphate kinase